MTTKSELATLDQGTLTAEQKKTVQDKYLEFDKTTIKSNAGGKSGASTMTLNVPSGVGSANNKITVTLSVEKRAKADDSPIVKNAEAGQVFIKDGILCVLGDSGRLYPVMDYAGEGAYEKLKKYYKGTFYDLG
ncbi:MAG: hypothetical protein LBT55_00690 [Clostridiaceae bacterium]|jgi:phage-related tail fiber protein|nr:hypothetical protein [Clostridiaceae bacterium]